MPAYDGGCLCGSVRFRVTAAPMDSGYCHCRMCQKNSGAPVVAWVTFPAEAFSWVAGDPGVYASSVDANRHFCARCGSFLVFKNNAFPSTISVNTASFDDPDAFPPRKHIFSESRVDWFNTADALPRFRGYHDDPIDSDS
jgi:hypothetical protein